MFLGGWEASSRDIIVDLLICPATIVYDRVTRLGDWGSKGGGWSVTELVQYSTCVLSE